MLSGRLVHLIESHWEEIISGVIAQIRREAELAHYRAAIESDLREKGRILLENLGHWLTSGKGDEIAQHWEQLGRLRLKDGMPVSESVHVLCIVRERVLDFAEEHVYSKTTLELYEQEELDRRLMRFFDLLTIHMVKGYERALRHESLARAGAASPQ